MYKFLVAILSTLAMCDAYNFKDTHFNEFIFESYKELRDQVESPQSLRVRRDTEEAKEDSCKWKNEARGVKCCNDKINPKPFEMVREFKKECFKEIHGENEEFHFDPFTCEKLENLRNEIICIGECVGRKLEIVDMNGDINRDALIEHMKTKFYDPDLETGNWKLEVSEEIIDKCLKDLQSSEESSSSLNPVCNPAALKVAHCVWREYVKACPKELQITSNKCIKLRERLQDGNSILNKGLFLRHFHYHEHDHERK